MAAGRSCPSRRRKSQTRRLAWGAVLPSSGGRYSLCTFRKRYAVAMETRTMKRTPPGARGRRSCSPGLRPAWAVPDAAASPDAASSAAPPPSASGRRRAGTGRRRADFGERIEVRWSTEVVSRQERTGPGSARRLPPEVDARRCRSSTHEVRGGDASSPALRAIVAGLPSLAGQPGGDLLPGLVDTTSRSPSAGRGSAFAQRRHRRLQPRTGWRSSPTMAASTCWQLDRRPAVLGAPWARHDTAAHASTPGRAAQLRHRAPAAAAAPRS